MRVYKKKKIAIQIISQATLTKNSQTLKGWRIAILKKTLVRRSFNTLHKHRNIKRKIAKDRDSLLKSIQKKTRIMWKRIMKKKSL